MLNPDCHPEDRRHDLTFRLATPADTEAIWQLLVSDFYPRTALCQHLGMRIPQDIEILRQYLPGIIEQGVSMVAVDHATGELVGARPSTLELLHHPDGTKSARKHPLVANAELARRYPKCSAVYRMFDWLDSSADLLRLQRFPGAARAIGFKFLVVRDSHAGRGVATQLIRRSLELAEQLGLDLASVITASRQSERIYDRLGFERVAELRLDDYVDPLTSERPFAGMENQLLENAVLFAKRI